jgi:hypothetical protein
MPCIYCHGDGPLQDEHIIAEGFGGDRVMPSASCNVCAKATSLIEHRVLRDGYGLRLLRSALGIGGRRPKERPTQGSIDVVREDQRVTELIAREAHPKPLSLPLFALVAGPGAPIDPKDIHIRGCHHYVLGPPGGDVLKQLGVREAYFKVRNYDIAFAQMLAKVAFCSWMDAFGDGHLEDSWLPSFILGRRRGIGRVVGTLDYAIRGQAESPCLHAVHLGVRTVSEFRYAVAGVQLLRQLTPSTSYFVVIGILKPMVTVDPAFSGWWLPPKGPVGRPISGALPRWVGTSLLSGPDTTDYQEVLAELRAAGLAP